MPGPDAALRDWLRIDRVLPSDHATALLVGRVWLDGLGPTLVQVRADGVYDLSALAATCSALLESDDPARDVRSHPGPRIGATAEPYSRKRCTSWTTKGTSKVAGRVGTASVSAPTSIACRKFNALMRECPGGRGFWRRATCSRSRPPA